MSIETGPAPRGALTTTSFAVLGLLSTRSWSTYELARQMERSLGYLWPRAQSKLYEEPKKLVAHGLAEAAVEVVGRRSRTVYAITDRGREALAEWLSRPAGTFVLESETLLKVFFADGGTTDALRETLAAAHDWAVRRAAESTAVGREYLTGQGPFPERLAVQQLTVRFLNDLYALVASWASWAAEVVAEWPGSPADASVERADIEATIRHSAAVAATRLVR